MNGVLVGAATGGSAPIIAACKSAGVQFSAQRDYATLSRDDSATWAAIANSDILLYASVKWLTDVAVPATDVSTGKYTGQHQHYANMLGGLKPHSSGLLPVITPEHEIDANAASASGTYPQLAAALSKCYDDIDATKAKVRKGLCWTSFLISQREPSFREQADRADVLIVDPYQIATKFPWVPFIEILAVVVAYLNAMHPGKAIVVGEWGCQPDPTGGTARANYLLQACKDMRDDPRVAGKIESVMYFNSGSNAINANEAAALATGYKYLAVPPVPPVPTVAVTVDDFHKLLGAAGDFVFQSGLLQGVLQKYVK